VSDPTEQQPIGTEPTHRPRIRTGAVIWGLVLVAVAAVTLWVATRPGGFDDVADAVLALDGFGWIIVTVIVIGATVTLISLAAVIRHVQHRLAKPSATTTR
jgi:hypothetical protein